MTIGLSVRGNTSYRHALRRGKEKETILMLLAMVANTGGVSLSKQTILPMVIASTLLKIGCWCNTRHPLQVSRGVGTTLQGY